MRRDATREREGETGKRPARGGVTRRRFSGGGTRNDNATRGLCFSTVVRPYGPSRGARAPQPQHAESGVLLLNRCRYDSVLTERLARFPGESPRVSFVDFSQTGTITRGCDARTFQCGLRTRCTALMDPREALEHRSSSTPSRECCCSGVRACLRAYRAPREDL